MQVPGSARAVNMTLSKNGKHLLVNYQDKVIRAFEVAGDTVAGHKSFSLPELRAHLSTLEVPSQCTLYNYSWKPRHQLCPEEQPLHDSLLHHTCES